MSAPENPVRDTLNPILQSLRGRIESELSSVQDELVRAAEEAGARMAAEASERTTLEVRGDADREIDELRESTAREAEEQRVRLTAEIDDLQHRLSEAQEESQRRLDESQRKLDESASQIEAVSRDIDTLRQDAEDARRQAETAREESEAVRRELESAQRELDTTREYVEATLRDIETARRNADGTRAELGQLHETMRRREERTSQALRLPDAVRALDDAATFGEVLEQLAQRAGSEAGRAAIFLVKGDRLRDWRTVGFGLASDAARLDIGLDESGLMAEAVRSADGVRWRGTETLPEFARSEESRDAAAWPVSVGGSVVAVLYADGLVADNPDEPYWPAFLDVLARHAGRVLEGITVRQAAGLLTGRAAVPPRASSAGHQSSGSIQ